MKKIYALFILCCFSVSAFAQMMTTTVNATGAPGSYKTGYAVNQGASSFRMDGDMLVRFDAAAPTNVQRGWAVFDLDGVIPPNSTIISVKLRFNISNTTNTSVVPNVGIYGYVGDLSLVTDPALVWAGANGNGIYTGTDFHTVGWGGVPATILDSFNASGIGFVHDNWDTVVTIGWQSNAVPSQTYTITGEGGTSATQPQLIVNYTCDGIAGVTAVAAPNPVCVGTTLSLTGTAIGATSYEWHGPNSYSSTSLNTSLPVSSVAAAGVYTLTAFNAGGCPTHATTAAIVVNPAPQPITGASTVCAGSTTPLTDASGPGTWSSSNPAIATIGAATGVVGGVAAGTTNITFTITSTGCQLVSPITVYALPATITGPSSVCENSTVTLGNTVTTGTWSSSITTVATIDPATGAIGTVSPGTTTITYSNGCGTGAQRTFTVNPLPASIIAGRVWVCSDSTIRLSDATSGGLWSSSKTSVATVGSTSGIVRGISHDSVEIYYTLPTTCRTSVRIYVDPSMDTTTGPHQVCALDSIDLANTSMSGGKWRSSNAVIATVDSVSGRVKGRNAGVVIISYTNSCGSSAVHTVTVNPLPGPITGPLGICITQTASVGNATTGGVWTIDNPSIATIDATGMVTPGTVPANVNITYTLPATGCFRTRTLTVTAAPPAVPIVGGSTVCVGQFIILSQETGVGVWSSSNAALATVNQLSGRVTGTGMGTVDITYTIGTGTGCTATRSILVRPLAPITGADSICNGSTTYLADIVGPGTWSSSNPSIATIDPISGFVTSVNPSMPRTVISYTTNTGCVTTHTLTVIAIPPPISGVLMTCPGAFTTLSNSTPGGVWSTAYPGTATATGTVGNSRIYGVSPDTVSVYYSVKPGCRRSALLTVNPNPAPITGLDNELCATQSTDTAYNATPGGVWSVGNTVLSVTAAGVVTSLAQGTGVVNYTIAATGCKATKNVIVNPLPVPVITYDKFAATFYTDTFYETYQWYNDFQGMIPGANSPNLAALYTQNYWVVVTDSNGCTNSSAHYFFDATLLGVGNMVTPVVKVYPNPATAVVYIDAPVNLRAVITALDGKQVLEQKGAKEISIRGLANGMYFISLYTDDNRMISVQKLIKE